MTTQVDSWGHGYQPTEGTWRAADLSVLLLVLVALLGGALLRQGNLNAVDSATANGVSLSVPRGAISRTEGETFIATTREGYTVRVETLELPPIWTNPDPEVGQDVNALAATRAIQLANGRQLFQSVETNATQVGDLPAALMEYQYVQADVAQAFSTGLQVISGYELLVPSGGQLYVISLEGPAEKRAELNALWSQIQSSVRFGG